MSITISILLVVVTIFIGIYVAFFKKPSNLSHLPSPSLAECVKTPFEDKPADKKIHDLLSKRLHKEKVQLIWRNGGWVVALSSADAARSMYNDTTTFVKRLPSEVRPNLLFSKFLGINLVFSNHQVWKRHRKVLNPPFKKQFEVELFEECIKEFFNVVDNKFNGTGVEIYKYMQRITMDALGKGIMGVDFNSVVNENVPFITYYNKVMKASFDPFYLILDFFDTSKNPLRKPVYDDLKSLEEHFQHILDEKKKAISNNDNNDHNVNEDILTLMLKAAQEEDVKFTDKEIRDNVMIFLLAGHDTTAFALSAALHFLAQHQDVQEKLRKEVMDVMGITNYSNQKVEDAQCPTIEQTKQMEYLLAVMKETMRLYPSVPDLPLRTTSKDVVVDGYTIPANTDVLLSIYTLHHDERYWNEPEKFIPERFIKGSSYAQNNPVDISAWTPFGGGARSCIGMNFSLLEQKAVLAMILLRYKVNYPKGSPQIHGEGLSLSPAPLFSPKDYSLNFTLL